MASVLFSVWFSIQGIIQNMTCSVFFRIQGIFQSTNCSVSFIIQGIIQKWPGYYSAYGLGFRVLFKIQPAGVRELLKTYKGYNSLVITKLLTGNETWVHMFEPLRRADNKQWKRKYQKRPCIAKRTIKFDKKDVVRNFLYFMWASRSSALSIRSYSHWPILQEFCTEESERVLQ